MLEEDNSRVPVPFSDLRNSGIQAELESFMEAGSEVTDDYGSSMSTDPGRVATDFDAAMTTSGDYGYTPRQQNRPFGIAYSSNAGARSYQPSHVKSPLQQSILPEEFSSDLGSSDEEDEITEANLDEALVAKYIASRRTSAVTGSAHSPPQTQIRSRPTSGVGEREAVTVPSERRAVSPLGPYKPPPPTEVDPALVPPSVPTTIAPPRLENRLSLASQHNMSITPRASREVAPPIEAERIKKLVASINIALDWARTLTESDTANISERDAVLAILYVLSNRLQQGAPSRHTPLYRSLQKTVKQLTVWSQEVVSHRDQYDWPVISVTLRGFIQKLRDFNTSLSIESDPAAIAIQLNTKIAQHNAHRAESEAIRQALKQKLREEKLARREERAQIRHMHEQLKTMKRAQKEGIELTERLDGMVSREAIRQPPSVGQPLSSRHGQSATGRSVGPTTVEAEMRSVITNDEEYERLQSPTEPPSISSLGEMLPQTGPERRGPGTSVHSAGEPLAPQSNGSSPKRAMSDRQNEQYHHRQGPHRPPSVPSAPSSKPLPHRPFSRTEEDLRVNDMDKSVIGTEIVEEELDMNGDLARSISFIPRNSGVALEYDGYSQDEDRVAEPPLSPRSQTSGVAPPPIYISPSNFTRSRRSGGSRSPTSQRSTVRSAGYPPDDLPEYQYSTMPEPWDEDAAEWKKETQVEDVHLDDEAMGKIQPEIEEEEDSLQADTELLTIFNRIVNVNSLGRGDILAQRVEPRGRISPEAPEYPSRAYQPPTETISRKLGVDDLDYPGVTRSGSLPSSFARQYRKKQSMSRPPRSRSPKAVSPGVTNTDTLPLTEHELDEPVHPYPMMNEHGWMKTNLEEASIDEHYTTDPNHPGVRIRMYDDGEQPGILEVLSPELPPLPSSRTYTSPRGRDSSHSSSRAPKIFAAMNEQAERERERERERESLLARNEIFAAMNERAEREHEREQESLFARNEMFAATNERVERERQRESLFARSANGGSFNGSRHGRANGNGDAASSLHRKVPSV